ncbi:MAG: hypothetical protein HKN47_25150 [Pirellulaceae bacterium]|nr:hypothetical protein [Pirellulaceae bacterium]
MRTGLYMRTGANLIICPVDYDGFANRNQFGFYMYLFDLHPLDRDLQHGKSVTPLVRAVCFMIACLMIAGGCSKDEMKEMAASVQQQSQDFAVRTKEYTQSAVQVVEQQLPASGSVSLRLSPPVEMDSAKVEVISVGDGRPNVVQISTYDLNALPGKFPCLLIHGTTDVETSASLTGRTVACDFYFQASASSPITMTPPGKSVAVTFAEFDVSKNTLKASIGSASLVGSDGKAVMFNGGTVMALVQGGN